MSRRVFGLLVAADGAQNRRPLVAGPLAQKQTDSARRRLHQHRVARFHFPGFVQQVICQQPLKRRCRRNFVRCVIGQPDQLVRTDDHFLRIGTDVHAIGDPVARCEISYTVTDRFNVASRLHADNRGQGRQRIGSGAVIDIDEIEARYRVAQQELASLWLADFDVLPLHDVRSAGFVNSDFFTCLRLDDRLPPWLFDEMDIAKIRRCVALPRASSTPPKAAHVTRTRFPVLAAANPNHLLSPPRPAVRQG